MYDDRAEPVQPAEVVEEQTVKGQLHRQDRKVQHVQGPVVVDSPEQQQEQAEARRLQREHHEEAHRHRVPGHVKHAPEVDKHRYQHEACRQERLMVALFLRQVNIHARTSGLWGNLTAQDAATRTSPHC